MIDSAAINPYSEMLGNIVFGIIVILAMGIFFEKKRTTLAVTILLYFFAFIFTSIQMLWLDIVSAASFVILNSLISITALFIMSLNYESSMIKRLAAISCINFLFVTVNNLLNLVTTPFWSDTDHLLGFVLPVITKVPILLVVLLFRRSFKHVKKSVTDLPMFWVPVLIITAALNSADIFSESGLGHISNFLIAAILFITSFMSFYLYNSLSKMYDDKLKSEINAQEKEYYLSQCQTMQDSVERMKSFRHDIKNHFAVLRDFTADNKAATDYLNSLVADIDKNEIYSDTGNLAFDSIINYKLRNAKKDNINLDINMFIPATINVEVHDVVIILGNLLDNALEALAKTEKKHFKLNIKYDKNSLVIKTDNTYNGQVHEVLDGKKEKDKLNTQSVNNTEHGYGLKNTKRCVEKYNGYMKTTYTNNVFSVVVLLYIENK